MKQNEDFPKSASSAATALGDGEGAPLVPRPPAKPGLLPTGLSRAIVIAAGLLAAAGTTAGLLTNRFAIVPTQRSENAAAYRIDRLTGRVSFCSASVCMPVVENKDVRR